MAKGHAEWMRRNRLVFYEKDIDKINEVLESFRNASQAHCVLLIDMEGHLVATKGFTDALDTTSIAALVAGSFASTREVARQLGEQEFSVLFHQGVNKNIHVSLVGERALVVIIFDDRTTIGMVRLYAKELAEKLTVALTEIERNTAESDHSGPLMGEGFSDAADKRLDDFFGEG